MARPIFRGDGVPHDWDLPPAPPWRRFTGGPPVGRVYDEDWADQHPNDVERARTYRFTPGEVELINIAILLRRPLLITGRPGTGKSTLAYAVAHELRLGPVLRWPVTSRTLLQDGLYHYDAIARLQDANLGRPADDAAGVGRYLRLGPLGTALLPAERPRVLLVDEIDKSDVDLPNDLLNVIEEGEFTIPELVRVADEAGEVRVGVDRFDGTAGVRGGVVRCRAFPIIVLTSNGEREFPPAFLRRCVRLEIAEPGPEQLASIVRAHLGDEAAEAGADIVQRFLERRSTGELATDQLLNAIFVTMSADGDRAELADRVIRHLSSAS
jgi:MoxR-like ATPase